MVVLDDEDDDEVEQLEQIRPPVVSGNLGRASKKLLEILKQMFIFGLWKVWERVGQFVPF